MAEILSNNSDVIERVKMATDIDELKNYIVFILERDEELRRTLNDMLYNLNENNIERLDFKKILYYNLTL